MVLAIDSVDTKKDMVSLLIAITDKHAPSTATLSPSLTRAVVEALVTARVQPVSCTSMLEIIADSTIPVNMD
jgi:hypothetical protein